jgi:hypothetical protein
MNAISVIATRTPQVQVLDDLDPRYVRVNRQHLADIYTDLQKLASRVNGLGMPEFDLPPAWWESKSLSV